MSDTLKSVLFAAGLCLVCSTLLTAASAGLKDIQQKNIMIDRRMNILKSVGIIKENETYASDQINSLFAANITRYMIDPSGLPIKAGDDDEEEGMPIYLYSEKDGPVEAYIIPVNTNGLWGKILGYLAIAGDGSTIKGFTVYKHSETPGLGGEIEQSWFRNNFVGKKIVNDKGGFVSISIAKGKVDDRFPESRKNNYVDGISGATITGKKLTTGLKEILTAYEPVSLSLRNNRSYCETNKDTPWCRK